MKHCLLSKELVISGKENREEFEQLLAELIEDFQPQSRTELSLVETIAICDWRFRRTLRAEAAEIVSDPVMLDQALPDAHATNKILRYQTTIHRQKMQALQLLEKLQQRSRNAPPTSFEAEPDAEKK